MENSVLPSHSFCWTTTTVKQKQWNKNEKIRVWWLLLVLFMEISWGYRRYCSSSLEPVEGQLLQGKNIFYARKHSLSWFIMVYHGVLSYVPWVSETDHHGRRDSDVWWQPELLRRRWPGQTFFFSTGNWWVKIMVTWLYLVGGLEHDFYFPLPSWDDDSIWLSYFSGGLKPPIRCDI